MALNGAGPKRTRRAVEPEEDILLGQGGPAAGEGVPKGPRIARDWIHATHPDTGLQVVFKAGEALPDWAPEA